MFFLVFFPDYLYKNVFSIFLGYPFWQYQVCVLSFTAWYRKVVKQVPRSWGKLKVSPPRENKIFVRLTHSRKLMVPHCTMKAVNKGHKIGGLDMTKIISQSFRNWSLHCRDIWRMKTLKVKRIVSYYFPLGNTEDNWQKGLTSRALVNARMRKMVLGDQESTSTDRSCACRRLTLEPLRRKIRLQMKPS